MCQVIDGLHPVPQSELSDFMQDEDSIVIVKVVSVSAECGVGSDPILLL